VRDFASLEAALEAAPDTPAPAPDDEARALVGVAEEVLAHWVLARGAAPTEHTREGFRLLALHHQGTRGVPSFNACRETCREIAWHFNLLTLEPAHAEAPHRVRMMRMLVKHLLLFVRGKLEIEGLGDFCCASRPLRTGAR
jgi:hypothetical protein